MSEPIKYNKLIILVSILIPVVVAILFTVKLPNVEPLSFLPPIYASINALTALLLISALVAIKNVSDNDDLMIINKSGIAIRLAVENLRVMGRATQGVKLINLKTNDSIAAVAKVMHGEDEEIDDDTAVNEAIIDNTENQLSESKTDEPTDKEE